MLGQPFDDVACLVNLAALNERMPAERAADRLDQRLRAIDASSRVSAPVTTMTGVSPVAVTLILAAVAGEPTMVATDATRAAKRTNFIVRSAL
jgi:hypothetical protein